MEERKTKSLVWGYIRVMKFLLPPPPDNFYIPMLGLTLLVLF
jgi:hypothetical protein